MQPFSYHRVSDTADALQAGGAPGAAFIGGGTLLVDLMKLGVQSPRTLVDLNGLGTEAASITEVAGGLRVGALVKNSDLAWHPFVQAHFPVLSEALLSGASPQLRNMATVGGNLMQRTRCAYFRDIAVETCNKRKPGSGCAAMEGWTRMHAILGVSDKCIAAHPSDMCVALVVLDAVVHVAGAGGARQIPIAEFHKTPTQPEIETVLAPGELVTAVTIPASPFAARSHYLKARDRASFAFALASAGVALHLEGRTIRAARVALGGVATKPWRSPEAEAALVGQPATRTTFQDAAALAFRDARTHGDNAFKIELGKRVLIRALETVGARS